MDNHSQTTLSDLPGAADDLWEGAEQYRHRPMPVQLCATHTRENWAGHEGYQQLADGSIKCSFCSWGSRVPGYYRVLGGKVIDLRHLAGE